MVDDVRVVVDGVDVMVVVVDVEVGVAVGGDDPAPVGDVVVVAVAIGGRPLNDDLPPPVVVIATAMPTTAEVPVVPEREPR